ncbi:MAG TPA: HU family DNA-binding protein [Candidatus Cloacimonadota bacterium]|jgi:nucleoid DNA-binding protein|nr:HU family DNA-binding protein [Candidatus Cloacimonadota bacterium]HOD54751.1 HU family DNA-binding protein [Candidatus Cloacimonadota bacterium]HPM00891.1 HU family DNA-binding protein [Candidatus Cloacimonadota bacterium]
MTKDELVKKVAEEAQISRNEANMAVNIIFESITDALKKNERVTFTGFGSFSVAVRKARKGYNPLTKSEIDIPEKKVPVFKAGSKLKEFIK